MTRGERLNRGLFRPGEVAKICGVPQSVLWHHYRSGYLPFPELMDGRLYFDQSAVEAIKRYFAARCRYERTLLPV
jgi:DNA-binding transcriptional MerR regulator